MFKILKFGGSSLGTPERIETVSDIILEEVNQSKIIVVVSAFQGITNELIKAAKMAASGDATYSDVYKNIADRHRKTLNQLIKKTIVMDDLNVFLEELDSHLQGIYLLRECSPRSLDVIASYGERLSALVISRYLGNLHPAQYVDAREFVITDNQYTHANVDFKATNQAIKDYFENFYHTKNTIPIVTGFIAQDGEGQITTLGRNGSDYSAAIIGAAVHVDLIEIWTDVDGIYTADPREVERAYVIPHLSYEEALELSHFGAKVLHSATIAPAVSKKIPILIKNTFSPSAPGTLISDTSDKTIKGVKGISSFANITLLTLRGMTMVGVPGIAERLFRTLANKNINIILISQASSEHTICFAISDNDVKTAESSLGSEFRLELDNQWMRLEKKSEQSIIAVVGEDMIGTPGVAGKFCYALGQNKISINAIAQGASERNISLAIDTSKSHRALNAVHQFFFETHKRLALCLIGVGNVGSALLTLLEQQFAKLYEKGFAISIVAIANSKQLLFDPKGIDLKHWQTHLKNSDEVFTIPELLHHLKESELNTIAFIDCTASKDIVENYPALIEKGIHIITPNKNANVLPWNAYQNLMDLLEKKQCHFLFEANVGAGLPIISTLQDLTVGGDTILSIEGIFSGTLSYLFNQYDGEVPFSEIIREAKASGFTEPDPREDLSGRDVARKLLILARQLNRKMDIEDVEVESLIPDELSVGVFSENFYEKFKSYDEKMLRRLEMASKNQCVLRYVGVLDEHGARSGVIEVPLHHPLALAKRSDNIITFTTERYALTPLVIQGPGAGAEVTAMGVFSDIYKLLHYLPY